MVDVDWLAYLECSGEEVGDAVYDFFSQKVPYTMCYEDSSRIMACRVEQDGRFITVFFNGDPIIGYSVFLNWAGTFSPNSVSLIQITHADAYPSMDRLDCRMLQDARSAMNKSPYYYDQEVLLIKTFTRKVVLGNFTREQLSRIVHSCRIGEDTCGAEHTALCALSTWQLCDRRVKNRVQYWIDSIQSSHVTGRKHQQWVDGDNLLVRVLAHLVYLEELNPTSFVDRVRKNKTTVRKMSL